MAVKSTSYRDNPLLKKVGVNVNYTQEQVEEYIRCSKDPVYFARHMKIISLDHGLMPFAMYEFQKDMIRMFNENRFVITKCPRQVGKCFYINTPIKLRNKSTGEIIETTIGEFYGQRNETNILSEEQR